jgi:hypothetical protein
MDNDMEWLREEIAAGLATLVSARLPGFPSADTVKATARVWLNAILDAHVVFSEEVDRPRVRQAFRTLTRVCYQWPSPRTFLDHLPPRPPVQALPEPPMSEEKMARNQRMVRDLIDKLKAGLAI